MRESTPRGWHRWRVTAVASAPAFDRLTRLPPPEPAAPDGIRHDLVARVRRLIADGTYDTEEKWLLAEEALLRRIEGRA